MSAAGGRVGVSGRQRGGPAARAPRGYARGWCGGARRSRGLTCPPERDADCVVLAVHQLRAGRARLGGGASVGRCSLHSGAGLATKLLLQHAAASAPPPAAAACGTAAPAGRAWHGMRTGGAPLGLRTRPRPACCARDRSAPRRRPRRRPAATPCRTPGAAPASALRTGRLPLARRARCLALDSPQGRRAVIAHAPGPAAATTSGPYDGFMPLLCP
jgi:hypothetical protein